MVYLHLILDHGPVILVFHVEKDFPDSRVIYNNTLCAKSKFSAYHNLHFFKMHITNLKKEKRNEKVT